MRVGFGILCNLATAAQAESWQFHPELELKAADVYLSTSNPATQYGSTNKALEGGFIWLREDFDSLWETKAQVETAVANLSPHGNSSFRSHYLSRQKLSSTNYEISYMKTHGFDPIGQLIEEAANRDARSLESMGGGVYHQLSWDVKNEVSFYLGLGKSTEGALKIESKDAQVSWEHHHSLEWTSRLRTRITDTESRQEEVIHEHLIRYSPKLSSDISYGYAWQDNQGNRSQGALWGMTLQFQTSGLIASPSAYQALSPIREISQEHTESMRGSSAYKVGWTHARDRRRLGDPYYYADIFYGSIKIDFFANQTLETKGSHSRASADQLRGSRSDYKSEIVEGNYTFRHRFVARLPDANLSLSYSAEHTDLSLRRYFREIYQARYSLIW